ncbi:MAG: tRNA uridine-5-carboxymethylaminomethyl(34) synthesis GTPase MnmE [Gemmatimonadota bacterium]|nr:MAG: tRNA uridine-5-carboxymethylaminomethyl(34) synthesis GTPase MnmE [Gemmatimonadota bacterium]
MFEDTIAAISTPPGEGGISIVRMSGPKALTIADGLFRGDRRPSQSPSHRILYGHVLELEAKRIIDEVLLMVMRAPRTYTAEDMVEINCHGGYLVSRNVLEVVLKCGARLAEPGEFTRRAFLNGRIDLTQAEAVLDIIRSRTGEGLRLGVEQLEGSLLRELEALRHHLVQILTQLEVAVDFSESDIQIAQRDMLITALEKILCRIGDLLQTSSSGKLIREGARLAIVGKPNVGKSSLLNALLKEDRAIVSPLPGTTQDTIEEWLDIEGLPLRVIDTAGLGTTANVIEEEGKRRTEERIYQADLVIFMLDGSIPMDERDDSIAQRLEGKKYLTVINKIDLEQRLESDGLQNSKRDLYIRISALHGQGLEELKRSILDAVLSGHSVPSEGVVVTRLRHRDALMRAKISLEQAVKTLTDGLSEEFVAVDIRDALATLGEITGQTTSEDILNRIFSEFCVGK